LWTGGILLQAAHSLPFSRRASWSRSSGQPPLAGPLVGSGIEHQDVIVRPDGLDGFGEAVGMKGWVRGLNIEGVGIGADGGWQRKA
jgi:hypothetical protein